MRMTVVPFARRPSGLACAIVLLALTPAAYAQGQIEHIVARAGIETVAPGRSDNRLKSQVSRIVPWNQISNTWRGEIRKVLDEGAQYRRLPEVRYAVDPSVYRYLVEHPDVSVSTWRAMNISKVEMWQTGAIDYEGRAPDGSEGLAHVVYRDDSQCMMLCKGTYSNPLLPKPITAAALLWMRYDFRQLPNGEQQVHQQTDVVLSFPSAAARTVALLASPVTNMMMDRNLFEISLYARMMSQASARDPEWFRQLAGQLDGVLPQRREELAALARQPSARTAARSAARPAMAPQPGSVPLRPAGRTLPLSAAPTHHHPPTLHMYRPGVPGAGVQHPGVQHQVPGTVPVPRTAVPAVPAAIQQPPGITRTAATGDSSSLEGMLSLLLAGDASAISAVEADTRAENAAAADPSRKSSREKSPCEESNGPDGSDGSKQLAGGGPTSDSAGSAKGQWKARRKDPAGK